MVEEASISSYIDSLANLQDMGPYSKSTGYYLLFSQDGCHTTWHRDFSATSVFYMVLRGEKIFLLVEPTDANVAIFDRWSEAESDVWYVICH